MNGFHRRGDFQKHEFSRGEFQSLSGGNSMNSKTVYDRIGLPMFVFPKKNQFNY